MRKIGKRDIGNLCPVLQLSNSCKESYFLFGSGHAKWWSCLSRISIFVTFSFRFHCFNFLILFFVPYSGCKHVLQIITYEIFYHHNLTERSQCTKSTEVMKITGTMKFYWSILDCTVYEDVINVENLPK